MIMNQSFKMPLLLSGCAALLLSACTPDTGKVESAGQPPAPSAFAPDATRILSTENAQRLQVNKGVTLQWLDWNTRGTAFVTQSNGVWKLRGSQAAPNGPGRLFMDGTITEIGSDYFTFEGKIAITDTPDVGRKCEKNKTWHFAVTQNRPYFRLREFEWCDGLTDYVDIYF